jgi:hypothetical protein
MIGMPRSAWLRAAGLVGGLGAAFAVGLRVMIAWSFGFSFLIRWK